MPAAGMSNVLSDATPSDWQALRLLTFYRVVIAGLLTVLHFALADNNPFNVQLPALFKSTLFTYLSFGIAAGFSTRLRWPGYRVQALVQVLADIGAIALLMHASGGVASSLSILLVIAVVVGALVLPGRTAYLFASVATLAILFETGLASLSLDKTDAGHVTRAGLMGAVLFVAAGLAHILAVRARESEALAAQRGVDLANLEQLNRYIVQQLESGVLVTDKDQVIRLANDNARSLLAMDPSARVTLADLAPALAQQFDHWRADQGWQPQPVDISNATTTVLPRFSELTTSKGKGALILLEDCSRLAQQTQQLKLASLGRLTASIAHEIRNPLAAISHAAQLLGESEPLNSGDRRLTEIISNHTRRVNEIIENVLQLSRRSVSQPQELRIAEWLHHFREDFSQSQGVNAHQLDLSVEPHDLQVRVDPGHLHQVLTNLCENALRHSAGEQPGIRLRAGRINNGGAFIEVINKGPDIDAATAEKMFEPFFTTAAGGTGLGLYIARELCEINQARLTYHSSADSGSCFRIQFA
jgi:two-component system sensor histidine kinase PilS (NtrC family)